MNDMVYPYHVYYHIMILIIYDYRVKPLSFPAPTPYYYQMITILYVSDIIALVINDCYDCFGCYDCYHECWYCYTLLWSF